MTNDITISITASGKNAFEVLKALGTLDGVTATVVTKPKAKAKTSAKNRIPTPKLGAVKKRAYLKTGGKRKEGQVRSTGRFQTREELFDYFLHHSNAGAGRTLTVAQVAESAEVTRQVAYGWQQRTGNSFKKGKNGRPTRA
jgi:hypothetical protein